MGILLTVSIKFICKFSSPYTVSKQRKDDLLIKVYHVSQKSLNAVALSIPIHSCSKTSAPEVSLFLTLQLTFSSPPE